MKIVDFETIQKLNISPRTCYDWVSEVIAEKDEMILPPKISMKPGESGVFYNCMPCILPKYNWGGVKLVTRYPRREPSLNSDILLYDYRDGSTIALMDGNFITAMRTGAVAAHSIVLLAKRGWKTIGMIGLGNTARAAIKVLLAVEPDREMHFKLLKYKDQHERFAADFAEYKNVHFSYCDSYVETVEGSDVIISAVTVFEENICEDRAFEEGCLVVPIHTRGFGNCDLFFDKVFADDVEHVRGFKYFDKFKRFAEVSDVVKGNVKGRESDTERILAYNIGISLHDIYFAGKIAEMVSECPRIDMKVPKEKFWL